MALKTEQEIMAATKPSEIFKMDPDSIVQQKDEYLAKFRPAPYKNIEHFMVTQRISLLYQQALEELRLKNVSNEASVDEILNIKSIDGEVFEFHCQSSSSSKLGTTYNSREKVIIVVESKYKAYYDNYIEKTNFFSKPDSKIGNTVQYMLPNIEKHFEDSKGRFVIILKKPCEIYPLRQVLEYFGGKMKPEYVASIMTKLYYFACYVDLCGKSHNGITVDNLFFSPGKFVEEGHDYTINDMRIVGVYGGWFFTTYSEEKMKGLPADVHEVLPEESLRSGYSSFRVDELSIKRLARELLGDPSGKNLTDVPAEFVKWVNEPSVARNAYEEFCNWQDIIDDTFGEHRFVQMDVSID
jgi:hypothetical protein